MLTRECAARKHQKCVLLTDTDLKVAAEHQKRGSRFTATRLPSSLPDFMEIANVAPSHLFVHPQPWGYPLTLRDTHNWLRNSPLAFFVPSAVEFETLLSDQPAGGALRPIRGSPHYRPEYPPDEVIQVALWTNVLVFITNVLRGIVRVRDAPFDVLAQGYAPIPWLNSFGERLEIGTGARLTFSRGDAAVTKIYENFRAALDGEQASRIQVCCARLRGDIGCGLLYYAKRSDQRACSAKHAQLMRQKDWLEGKKGREYYKRRLKEAAKTTNNND